MNVKQLKEYIKDLPDDMEVYYIDGGGGTVKIDSGKLIID